MHLPILLLIVCCLQWSINSQVWPGEECDSHSNQGDDRCDRTERTMADQTQIGDRIVGAVVGGIVAEAAGVHLHWIYDPATLKKAIGGHKDAPEFLPENNCPFYNIPVGRSGCCGEQAICLLKSLVDKQGLDIADFQKRLYQTFGPDSDYEIDLGHPIGKEDFPVTGPWRPGHMKAFIENFEERVEPMGVKEGTTGNAHGHLVPLVALYAGRPELLSLAEQVIRVTHNNDLSVTAALAAVRVLEQYILDGSVDPQVAVQTVLSSTSQEMADSITKVLEAKDMDHHEAVQKFQSHCGYPPNLQCSLHALLSAPKNADFPTSVRPTLTACGENLPRVMLAGACAGARLGLQGVPNGWIEKTLHSQEVIELAKKLAALRSTLS